MLNNVLEALKSFWDLMIFVFSGLEINDILDIAVITFIIYKCIGFFKETRGGQLIKGLLVLLVVSLMAQWLNMVMVKWLTVRIMDSILIAAVVIFQPELRRALERVGTSKFSFLSRNNGVDLEKEALEKQIDAVSKSAGTMQEQKCGALMVFEKKTQLGEIVSTGTLVDAASSPSLICNIFYPKSPLHDGAMILRSGKVFAAGCILPLTQKSDLNKSLGTRHRAALGMSENSDAVVVVVSEETGTISVAVNGELRRGFDAITLRTELTSLLIGDYEDKTSGFFAGILTKVSQSVKSKKK